MTLTLNSASEQTNRLRVGADDNGGSKQSPDLELLPSSDVRSTPAVRVISVVSPAPRDAWEDLVSRDPDALVTQTPSWTEAMLRTGAFTDRSRLYELSDGRRFVLPLARRRGIGGLVLGDQGFPNGWGMGGLVGPGVDASAIRAVFDDLGRRVTRVQIRPNPLHGAHYRDGATPRVMATPKYAHVIDMRKGEADVWTRMSKGGRNCIRRGQKSALVVETGNSEKLIREYKELHRASTVRWAQQQHEPTWLAQFRAERRDGTKKWLTIAEVLGSRCQVSVARLDGEPVAAMVLLVGPNGHETRSAMDRDAAKGTEPVYLLSWLGIEASLREGANWYHLGETGTSKSLAAFKEKFAADPYTYAEYRMERFPVTALDQKLRRIVKRLIGFRD